MRGELDHALVGGKALYSRATVSEHGVWLTGVGCAREESGRRGTAGERARG